MASNKPKFTFRTEQNNLDMLDKIAKENDRSSNKELEHILLKHIKNYKDNNTKTENPQ